MVLPLFKIGAVSLFWSGMIAAISMEARVKFTAPTLTRLAAIDVGRTVFAAFNKVEMALCAAGWAAIAMNRPSPSAMAAFGVATAAHLIQITMISPRLQRNALNLINATPERPAPPSNPRVHIAYVVFEGIKLVALLTCAGMAL